MSAAHKITARGYPVTARAYITDNGDVHRIPNGLQNSPNAPQICASGVLIAAGDQLGLENARVHLFARRVHFARAVWRPAGAATLDAEIAANLRELGYGG